MTANTNIPAQYIHIKGRIQSAIKDGRWNDILEGFTVVKKTDESHYAKIEIDQVEVSPEWEAHPHLARLISRAILAAAGSAFHIPTIPHQHKKAWQEIMLLPIPKRWEILCAIACIAEDECTTRWLFRGTDIKAGIFSWDGKNGYHPLKAEAIILGAVRLDKHYHAGVRGGEVAEYTLLDDTFIDANCVERKVKMPKGKITGDAHYAFSGDFIVE